MNRQQSLLATGGLTDGEDRLLSADEALAELQESCGGSLPGMLAIPELLDLVRQSRISGLGIARGFSAFDGEGTVSGFARIHPLASKEGGGCEVLIDSWQRSDKGAASSRDAAQQIDEIDAASAEIVLRLDARQQVQLVSVSAPDAYALKSAIAEKPGMPWDSYLEVQGVAHHQPLHWRLLDGSACRVPGSERDWRVRLLPIGDSPSAPRGFDLLLIADEPAPIAAETAQSNEERAQSRLIGSALTPVLRQPIARVIANAETIRARLAGPLREDYSEYAGNIVAAGQHLSAMLDDLADLEVVEAPDFTTAAEPVDIADAARRAAGILGVRAQGKEISVDLSGAQNEVQGVGDFRRVLQILINLIGNAIAYSPEGTSVRVDAGHPDTQTVTVSVSDQGPGVDHEQAERIFDKFERLGRDQDGGNDTGSGLGLYISRKLALAMGGDLEVNSNGGGAEAGGATFILTLRAAG